MSKPAFTALVRSTEHALGEVALWPNSQSAFDDAKTQLALLKKTLKMENYATAIVRAVMLRITATLLDEVEMREANAEGLRKAWDMLGDALIDKHL